MSDDLFAYMDDREQELLKRLNQARANLELKEDRYREYLQAKEEYDAALAEESRVRAEIREYLTRGTSTLAPAPAIATSDSDDGGREPGKLPNQIGIVTAPGALYRLLRDESESDELNHALDEAGWRRQGYGQTFLVPLDRTAADALLTIVDDVQQRQLPKKQQRLKQAAAEIADEIRQLA